MSAAGGKESALRPPAADPELEAFFLATQTAAYSLALRVTGSAPRAEEACARAYGELTRPFEEAALMEAVREASLALAGSAPPAERKTAAARAAFESLEHLQRAALELAHGSGMGVAEIARTLGRPAGEVRAALRDGLLRLAAASKEFAS